MTLAMPPRKSASTDDRRCLGDDLNMEEEHEEGWGEGRGGCEAKGLCEGDSVVGREMLILLIMSSGLILLL